MKSWRPDWSRCIDPTVPDVPYRDPAQVNLAELRVRSSPKRTAAADGEWPAWFGERPRRLPPWFARWKNPPGLSGGGLRPGDEADRRMAATASDYLRELVRVKSIAAYCLLDNWSRIARICRLRILGRAGRVSCGDDPIPPPLRCDSCPAYIHAALPHGESSRRQFRGFSHTMAFNVAGWRPPWCDRRVEHKPAHRGAGGCCPWREDVALRVHSVGRSLRGWKPSLYLRL